jgi:hypothetical protein
MMMIIFNLFILPSNELSIGETCVHTGTTRTIGKIRTHEHFNAILWQQTRHMNGKRSSGVMCVCVCVRAPARCACNSVDPALRIVEVMPIEHAAGRRGGEGLATAEGPGYI